MHDDAVIDHLSRLVAICRDGEAAYRSAAQKATDPQSRDLFAGVADKRSKSVSALSSLASAQDGELRAPHSCGHGEPQMRSAPMPGYRGTFLTHLRQIEEQALVAFSETLAQDLPIDIRAVVEEHYRAVRRAYGQLVTLASLTG
jgi:uncharacterized protein (TIGR02284 family)